MSPGKPPRILQFLNKTRLKIGSISESGLPQLNALPVLPFVIAAPMTEAPVAINAFRDVGAQTGVLSAYGCSFLAKWLLLRPMFQDEVI